MVCGKMSRKYILHVTVLFVTNVLWIASASGADCGVGHDEIQWLEAENGSIVNVELSILKNQSLCNSKKNCSNQAKPNASSALLQIHPITLQYGQILRIYVHQSEMCGNCSVKIHKVNISQLQDCSVVGSETNFQMENSPIDKTTVVGATNSHKDQNFFADYILEQGFHFFIVEVPVNDSIGCDGGFRLNVTVKDQSCRQNDTALLCSGHGMCVSSTYQASFTCRCCGAYLGQFCEYQCINDTCSSPCHHNSCQHGGTCIVDNNNTDTIMGYRCVCPRSTTGSHCEHLLTGCMSNPCVHGICSETTTSYQCYCVPGFHGKQCELEYNECLSNPCQNLGTCIDRIDKYECRCTHGHKGINCQDKVDLCLPGPCHNNATCIDKGDTAYCVCPAGITGATCEESIKECASSPCHNQGTCIDLERGFECRCPITFAGVHCEYMMDVFAPALDRTSLNGEAHVHNLYIVAGTLCGAICLMAVILLGCYCKMHETYRQLTWRRNRYKRRSLSCPDLESYGKSKTFSKSRLSVDAVLEATSLCYDNTSFETPLKHSLQVQQI